MLVDVGQGIVQSIEKGFSDLGFILSSPSSTPSPYFASPISSSSLYPSSKASVLEYIPDALLITHAHDDHIKELPILIDKVINSGNNSKKLSIFCTQQCYEQIIKTFPQFSSSNTASSKYISFSIVQPNNTFNVGPFSVIPLLANHNVAGGGYNNSNNSNNSNSGSNDGAVIYLVHVNDKKIIIGWDFLSLPNADEHLLWNPDLLILGTQSYNSHPETGMISVTDAYTLVRRRNAKESYIVHYSGLKDFEESKNQWFRGPVKPMTSEQLQQTINSNIPITGGDDFRITVAKEGMIYSLENGQDKQKIQQQYDSNVPIGNELLIEALQRYLLRFERDNKNDKLKLMVEDRINRYDLSFDRPRKDRNNDNIVYAEGEKGMLAKGPDFKMQVIEATSQQNPAIVRINAFKGRKSVFRDDIPIDNTDAKRLIQYIKENFKIPIQQQQYY